MTMIPTFKDGDGSLSPVIWSYERCVDLKAIRPGNRTASFLTFNEYSKWALRCLESRQELESSISVD